MINIIDRNRLKLWSMTSEKSPTMDEQSQLSVSPDTARELDHMVMKNNMCLGQVLAKLVRLHPRHGASGSGTGFKDRG